MKWSVVVILSENNAPFANSRGNGIVGSFWVCQCYISFNGELFSLDIPVLN